MTTTTKTVFAEYGVTEEEITSTVFTDNPSGLIKLRNIYSNLCESMKGSQSLTKEDTDKFKEQAKKNEAAQEFAKKFNSELLEMVYNGFDAEPETLVLVLESLDDAVKLFKYELKDYVTSLTKSDTEKVAENKDDLEKYEALESIRTMIDSVWKMQKEYLKDTLTKNPVFKEDGEFPLKDSTNGLVPDLPRMPDKPGVQRKGGGRPVHSSNLRFNWNGQDIPTTTKGPEICRTMISDRRKGVNITWKDIRTRLEAMHKDPSKDSWELEFPTGTLKGWVEKSTPVVSKGKEDKEASKK